jgi:hypothetical protein
MRNTAVQHVFMRASPGPRARGPTMRFQEMTMALDRFWADRGCVIAPPHDTEVGAGTFYPTTFLRALGPEPWRVAGIAPSRRPADGRYGRTRTASSTTTSTRWCSSRRRPTSRTPTSRRSTTSASTRSPTTSASSRTTGSRRPWAPGGSAGRCGWTGWRSPSSPTSNRSAGSTARPCRSSSPTASSASRCTSRESNTRSTSRSRRASRSATCGRLRAPALHVQLRPRRRRPAAPALRALRGRDAAPARAWTSSTPPTSSPCAARTRSTCSTPAGCSRTPSARATSSGCVA